MVLLNISVGLMLNPRTVLSELTKVLTEGKGGWYQNCLLFMRKI